MSGSRQRRWPWVAGGMGLGIAVVAIFLFLSDWSLVTRSDVVIQSARLIEADRIELVVESCNARPQVAEIKETSTSVTVTVTSLVAYFVEGGEDCLDLSEVNLEAPLGDRPLIDGSSGDVVQVEPLMP